MSLEINRPTSPVLAALFFLYFGHFPAIAARLIGADPAAYRYLPESVRQYPSPERVAEIMRDASLQEIHIERHMAGAIVLHQGIKA